MNVTLEVDVADCRDLRPASVSTQRSTTSTLPCSVGYSEGPCQNPISVVGALVTQQHKRVPLRQPRVLVFVGGDEFRQKMREVGAFGGSLRRDIGTASWSSVLPSLTIERKSLPIASNAPDFLVRGKTA